MLTVVGLTAGSTGSVASTGSPASRGPGTVAADWQATGPFTHGRTSAGSARIGDRLYVVGGYSYDSEAQQLNLYNDVQSARLSAQGGVTEGWHATTPFSGERLGAGVFARKKRVYVIGGGDGGSGYYGDVQYAEVDADGDIAADGWHTSPYQLNTPRAAFATGTYRFHSRTYAYVAGGVGNDADGNTVHYADVEYAELHPDGSTGPWSRMASTFSRPRSSLNAAWSGGCLYIVGGFGDLLEDVFSDVQYSCLTSGGTLGPWTVSPHAMHHVRYGAALFVRRAPRHHGVELIVAGGNAGGGVYLNQVEHTVARGADGIGPWTEAPESAWLPQPQWGQTGETYAGKAYVLGGVTRDQTYLPQTIWAKLRSLR